MKVPFFTKDKIAFLSASILLLALISIVLGSYRVPPYALICVWVLSLLPLCLYMTIDHVRKRSYYKEILRISSQLNETYLLPNLIEKPDFYEGELLYELLYDSGKSMLEQVNRHKQAQLDYREYIEQWVHEIKTPVAALSLLLENGGDKQTFLAELSQVEGYIQQVLYYARSQNPEKDFFVKEFDLSELIGDVIKKQARTFITNKIRLDYDPTPAIVYADRKWTSYILEQLISNAMKYTIGSDRALAIYGVDGKNGYCLTIADNGVGIPACDLSRIFDKGFTGENGRKFGRSTGMGLYLCKTLCDKLFIGLSVSSEVGVGTKVALTFPKRSVYGQ